MWRSNSTRPKKKSKLGMKNIVSTSLRCLGKATNFYMKSMEQLDKGFTGCPSPHVSTLSRSNSTKPSDVVRVRGVTGLPRSASENTTRTRDSSMMMGSSSPMAAKKNRFLGGGVNMMVKSYSVGGGKMGKIDEDEVGSLLYPRSKSTKRILFFKF